MRIAFISYEFPPDTAFGGIATYIGQVSIMMHKRGHSVEVFTASEKKIGYHNLNGIGVNYITTIDRETFKDLVLPIFMIRHQEMPFDIVESPEYNADGLRIKEKFTNLPFTVKLHTPKFLIDRLNKNIPIVHWLMKIRILIAGYRRLKNPNRYWKYERKKDLEYKLVKISDLITTPSVSLGCIVSKEWKIPAKKIITIPYPFIPPLALLSIPVENDLKTITYMGRLESRKGVQIFINVIPVIAQKYPEFIFCFVGKDSIYPGTALTMKEFLLTQLNKHTSRLKFIDHIPQEKISQILKESSICIFPSVWENFPNVCLEAMSAGRAIIASRNGGMKDMLEYPLCGILVDPTSSEEILAAIEKLICNREFRLSIGQQARQSVLKKYNAHKIGELIESYYLPLLA